MKHKNPLPTRLTALLLAAALLLTSCEGRISDTAMDLRKIAATAMDLKKITATTMHLKKTEGSVDVSDGEGKEITPKNNLGLFSGYQVETLEESYAWIALDRVKLTKMDADSQVEIIKDGKKLEINVNSGSLFFNVAKPLDEDETMNIRTSAMIVGIRGTCGWVTDNSVALLEGTVSITAGEQTATITAGEIAVLTAEGRLEVTNFIPNDVPAFVVEEIADDDSLTQDVLDATGFDIPAYSMAPYEDLLSTLEHVVYSELIDFEGDKSPELLVISMDFSRAPSDSVGMDGIQFYRNGPLGPKYLGGTGVNMHARGSYSLVESNGKLFVQRYLESKSKDRYGRIAYFIDYCGSSPQSNKDNEIWGGVDFINQGHVSAHNDKGLIDIQGGYDNVNPQEVEDKYTLVRELVNFEGENVTVAGQ